QAGWRDEHHVAGHERQGVHRDDARNRRPAHRRDRREEEIEGQPGEKPGSGREYDEDHTVDPAAVPLADIAASKSPDHSESRADHRWMDEEEEQGSQPPRDPDRDPGRVPEIRGEQEHPEKRRRDHEYARVHGQGSDGHRGGKTRSTSEMRRADELPDLPGDVPPEARNEPHASQVQEPHARAHPEQEQPPYEHAPGEPGDMQRERRHEETWPERPLVGTQLGCIAAHEEEEKRERNDDEDEPRRPAPRQPLPIGAIHVATTPPSSSTPPRRRLPATITHA